MSAQKTELIVLTKVRAEKNETQRAGMALLPLMSMGAIYRERGLLLAEEKTIKIKEHILFLQRALWGPKDWLSPTA